MIAEAPGKILMECMASWVTWVSQMTSIKGDWAAVSFQPRPTFDLEYPISNQPNLVIDFICMWD